MHREHKIELNVVLPSQCIIFVYTHTHNIESGTYSSMQCSL